VTDWRKLDAALAAALGSAALGAAEQLLTVFVHFDADGAQRLRRMGIGADPAVGIATATLPASDVEALSEQPWVRRIRLSSPLRLLDDQ